MIADPRQLQKVSDDVFDLDGSHTTDVGMYKKTTSNDSEYNQSESATGCCRVQQNAYAANYFPPIGPPMAYPYRTWWYIRHA